MELLMWQASSVIVVRTPPVLLGPGTFVLVPNPYGLAYSRKLTRAAVTLSATQFSAGGAQLYTRTPGPFIVSAAPSQRVVSPEQPRRPPMQYLIEGTFWLRITFREGQKPLHIEVEVRGEGQDQNVIFDMTHPGLYERQVSMSGKKMVALRIARIPKGRDPWAAFRSTVILEADFPLWLDRTLTLPDMTQYPTPQQLAGATLQTVEWRLHTNVATQNMPFDERQLWGNDPIHKLQLRRPVVKHQLPYQIRLETVARVQPSFLLPEGGVTPVVPYGLEPPQLPWLEVTLQQRLYFEMSLWMAAPMQQILTGWRQVTMKDDQQRLEAAQSTEEWSKAGEEEERARKERATDEDGWV